MPRFSINVSFMFHENAFLGRSAAAADPRFAAIEIQFPCDHPAEVVAQRAQAAEVEVVPINLSVAAGD